MGHPLEVRSAGVLLHPSSLPGPGYCGDFGANARRFLDLVSQAGLRIWQVLPLGPTCEDGSPYQSPSVHAGNPDLIDLQWLAEQGWLSSEEAIRGSSDAIAKRQALGAAWHPFKRLLDRRPDSDMARNYRAYLSDSQFWLEDFIRFQAFRDHFEQAHWHDWPSAIRDRDRGACNDLAGQLREAIDAVRFGQFVFHCQWSALRQYANERGVLLFGDMPIYLHLDSADVWAHRDQFDLDDQAQPVTVTGVPPDYFSVEGQLWGNPQYHWTRMQQDGFQWWMQRFATASRLFDILRIDHFRAMEAYWEIPAHAQKATEGHWVHAPGRDLLQKAQERFPQLCLVAENLGIISPEVEALRHEFSLPGMAILQFAFDGNPENPYLPQNHSSGDIVYTGTHDNNTTLGWFEELDDHTRSMVYAAFPPTEEGMPWMLIRQAMLSRANTAMIPWQDFLGLGSEHRMNKPGTISEGNWGWRFSWDMVPDNFASRLREMLATSQRSRTNGGRSAA